MTELDIFPPALIMMVGALLLPLIPGNIRGWVAILVPLITLLVIWDIPRSENFMAAHWFIAGFDIIPVMVHPFSHIFATVFAAAAAVGGIYALNQHRTVEASSALFYAGGGIGVLFAGDFITLFIYWELMAVGSTILVWCGGERAKQAGLRYAFMHFIGGVLMLIGIVAQVQATGSTELASFNVSWEVITNLSLSNLSLVAPVCILLSVLINAGAPPFSSWLPESYPESSVSGMVFLSAYTTKTSVFVLLTLFAGSQVLIYVGLFMVFYGIIWALLENDMRRILAYSIINQVGFMVTGAGIGTELALNGAAAHAFCHIIYKALLVMSAGSVLYMTGKRRCSDLGGLFRTMHVSMICGVIGALAISSFPMTSGFISKSMISSSAAAEQLVWVWFLLMAASAGVFLHAGIKFPWFVFFQKDSGMRPKDPPWNMQLAMIVFAIACVVPGIFPELVYFMLPVDIGYEPNTGMHIAAQLQLLLFAGLAFFILLPFLKRTETISLDFDWIYRVPGMYILTLLDVFATWIYGLVTKTTLGFVRVLLPAIARIHGADGVMARAMPIGTTILWMTGLLGVYLIVYYLR